VQANVDRATGMLVIAVETLHTAATGGVDAGDTAIAGSIAVNDVVSVSHAVVDAGAQLNQAVATPDPAQTITMTATNATHVDSVAGLDADGDNLGGGAGLDVGLIGKETLVTLAGTASAVGDMTLRAIASEDVVSIATAEAQGDNGSLAGA